MNPAASPMKHPMEGRWRVISAVSNGVSLTSEMLVGVFITVHGDRLDTVTPHRTNSSKILVPSEDVPGALDIDMDGQTGRGLYEIVGTTLRMIHGPIGTPRPTSFEAPEGSKLTLMTALRA